MIPDVMLAEHVLSSGSGASHGKVLVVDDMPKNRKLLQDLLAACGYSVLVAESGEEALRRIEVERPDLVLLDVIMPGMDGYEVCRTVRRNPATQLLPVVMVTALDPAKERINGLKAGADDFLAKPINQEELLVRVRSLLRIKTLYDTVRSQSIQLDEWNRTLEHRVEEQIGEIEKLGQLRRFLSPEIGKLITGGAEEMLRSHRREVTVAFLDLRGFTAFAETTEPEEVMNVLREYHAEAGRHVTANKGNLERFTGDGMMIVLNDPVEIDDPEGRAVAMALELQRWMTSKRREWARRGFDLGHGIGIATGYATMGRIGYEGRWDYGTIGTVPNLAARLCSRADPGQILVTEKFLARVEERVEAEALGRVTFRGFHRQFEVFNILGPRETQLTMPPI